MSIEATEFQAGYECGIISAARYLFEEYYLREMARAILSEGGIMTLDDLKATRATSEDIEALEELF